MDIEEALSYPKHGSLAKWFHNQVSHTPEKIALTDGKQAFSFQELDDLTSLLAKYLIAKFEIKKNSSVITIYMEISVNHVIANLAIIKSGAAYMDLYNSTGTSGVTEMCQNIEPVLLIVSTANAHKIKDIGVSYFTLDENWPKRIQDSNLNVELPSLNVDDVSYIAYTSGTTGKPKGIVCPLHAPMYSYHYLHRLLPFEKDEVYGCNVYITWEVMRPLLEGVQAFIIDPATMENKELLQKCIKKNSITRMMITASILEQILMHPKFISDAYASIKYFMICGEVLTVKLAKRLRRTFPWIKMYNLYSIAETHDVAICDINAFLENGHNSESAYCPVGKPSHGATFRILDEDRQPVPIGKPGEIYLSSPTLALRYMNAPDLTSRAFTVHNGQRIYKSGDVGRFSLDNNLEVWGRCDSMTKIKGYSVDLKSVETIILQHPCVNACVLSVTGTLSDRKLIVYIVANGEVTSEEMENYVASKTFCNVTPDQFIFIENVPVNVKTSKFDLKALKIMAQEETTK